MASSVSISNRALQILGQPSITSLDENSVAARNCNLAYEPILHSELRAHAWNFSIKRAALAASTVEPIDDYDNAFPLPSDYLRLLPPNDNFLDWQIESHEDQPCILTNYDAPLYIRYVSSDIDVNAMDAEFRECVSAKMAEQMCEAITQSNSKQAAARQNYKEAIARARRTNAFENPSAEAPVDEWVTARGDQ